MKANKLFLVIFAVAVTSCYFFPFVPAVLPQANSKMILAVVGLVLLGINLTKKSNASVDHDFLNLTIWAFTISLISFISVTLNHTQDNTFTTYFMSMWVWLGGAYAVVSLIKAIHGGISVPLIVNYLIAVCIIQCILALIFDSNTTAEDWHERIFAGEGYMGNTDESRMHGIGCSLDVAGFRFAAVICMSAFLLCREYGKKSSLVLIFYLIAICFVTIVGNMISRSTGVGSVIALVYIILTSFVKRENNKLLLHLFLFAVCTSMICVYLYNIDVNFRDNIRFGFEGFFSLAETGEWQTNSNNILKDMVVWPNNFKTWIIGDGYFDNPTVANTMSFDQYYIGPSFNGYYMNTDIGYLRYIFYFGVFGLIAFSLFLIQTCKICMNRFKTFSLMFLLVLTLNFIEWFKVSTDLFVVFAPFLCISAKENDEYIIQSETLEKA